MPSRKIVETILFVSLFVVFCSLPGKCVIALEKVDIARIAIEGGKLSSEEATKLEEKLSKNQDDLSARTMLLGYYELKAFRSESARKERQKHIMWVIQNHPESEIAGIPLTMLDPIIDKEVYYEAKKLWLKQVDLHKESTAIVGNAAKFFLVHDQDTAESLLKKAKELEPNNPEWPSRLGDLYSLSIPYKSGKSKRKAAVNSLEQMEEALKLTGEERHRFYVLTGLPKIAFEAGEPGKASKYASDLLQKAPQYKGDWNYGNAIHQGNVILGRIALASGKLQEAKDYLIRAGKISGSPQLNSFGPNMTLARELLEKGERKVVIEYFRLCANFWEMGKDQLRSWTTIVNTGGMPDFGTNLSY